MGNRAIVIAGLLSSASLALADGIELTLQWQDSLTVEGTRYTCNDKSRRGVQLAPGDKITAGGFRLKCARRSEGGPDDGPPGPPPAGSSVTVTSFVDTSCLTQMNTSISGRVPQKDVPLWADACRTPPLDRRCTVVSSKPDNSCFSALDQLISGSFSGDVVVEAQRACNRIEASCTTRGGKKVTSSVDTSCVTQLYTKTSGRPTAATITTWIDSCRAQNVARCTIVGSKFNSTCYSQAYSYMSGRPSVTDAAGMARACTTYELACE
jgi:hypothetical protein